MNVGLKHFRAFVAVASNLHFGRAANEINVSQPTLTLLIQQMESAVGTRLFSRSTRQVELTEMGREFLPLATGIINDLSTAVGYMREFVELKRGKVTVAAFPSVAANILPPVIVEFRRRHPEVAVHIVDGAAEVILDKVRSRTADFAVGGCPADIKEFSFAPIYNDDIKILLPRGHPLSDRKSVAWRQIIDEEIVTVSAETGIRRLIDKSLAENGMYMKAILEPTLVHTVVAMAVAGAGLGVVLSSYLSTLPMDNHVALPLVKPTVLRSVGMISRSGHRLTPAAKVLHGMIVQRLTKIGAGSVGPNSQDLKTPAAGILRPSVHTTRPGRRRGSA